MACQLRGCIRSLTPRRMRSQFTGYYFAKPASIAICIANQNSGLPAFATEPKTGSNQANWRSAIAPYIPICHDEIEKASAFTACQIPCPTDRSRTGLIVKY
jgi:hypothetical protein